MIAKKISGSQATSRTIRDDSLQRPCLDPASRTAALREAVIHELAVQGGAALLPELKACLRGRSRGLLNVLTGLVADGTLEEVSWITTGRRWSKQVIAYRFRRDRSTDGSRTCLTAVVDASALAAVESAFKRPAGAVGAQEADNAAAVTVAAEATAVDAAIDAEFADSTCPGCELPWSGPGWCGSCSRVEGWHP